MGIMLVYPCSFSCSLNSHIIKDELFIYVYVKIAINITTYLKQHSTLPVNIKNGEKISWFHYIGQLSTVCGHNCLKWSTQIYVKHYFSHQFVLRLYLHFHIHFYFVGSNE